ncbi:helix-turn-helix domain-containing protein [Streptosporangium saharense]|uniref:helix-turn-helix domain-containing protein n=1 Tax=Streptosporangium saharense TaxID=1706840 RepID=UPI003423DB85
MGAESQEWNEFCHAIRKRREEYPMTQRQLGELIRWNYSMVSRWESGVLTPSAEVIEALDAALNAGGEVISLGLQAAIADSNRLRKGTVEEKASTRDESEDMDRRRLMRDAAAVAVGGAVAPVLATLTDAWQSSEPRIPGATVSQEMIDDWEDAADVHVKRAYVDAPAIVLAGLAADFADMAPHLSRFQPESVDRGLARAAAQHAALIAGKWFDLGYHREAHRWWKKTRTLSERAGDTLLAAWLIGWEAAYRRQDPDEDLNAVLAIAQLARRLAGDRPSLPLVDNCGSEAQILAMLGRHDEAIAAWRVTEEAFNRLPSGITAPDPGSMHYARSVIYTFVGDAKQASDAQSATEGLYQPEHRTATLLAFHNAALQSRTDPAQGAQRALQIMERLPAARRDIRVKAAARIVLEVAPEEARGLPAVRELRALTTSQSA